MKKNIRTFAFMQTLLFLFLGSLFAFTTTAYAGYVDHSKVTLAYDAYGDSCWDYGNGCFGTVGSIEELDQDTVTICNYVINTRTNNWLQNHINCFGYDKGHINFLIVNENDPRYTGDGPFLSPGWEYFIVTVDGRGNTIN